MIHHGDCLEVMAGFEPESVDAIVTDPPYGLEFMGKEWDKLRVGPARKGNPFDAATAIAKDSGAAPRAKDNPWQKEATGYGAPNRMPKCGLCGKWKYNGSKASQCACPAPQWVVDTWTYPRKMGEWHEAWAREAYRVAKPSAYLLAFGGTRTVHRLTSAIEDAGWIIRDMLVWAYASGFPKSKASLKPAWEPIVMARKPGPLRELAIDACRIGHDEPEKTTQRNGRMWLGVMANTDTAASASPLGRWPANVILTDPIFDGGWDGVVGGGEANRWYNGDDDAKRESPAGMFGVGVRPASEHYGDSGTYSRFFLVPKADRADREPVLGGLPIAVVNITEGHGRGPVNTSKGDGTGIRENRARQNVHPTVKPTELMRHLVRLVTPTGGIVLDPFLGSGSTGIAAEMEGFAWIGIEKEAEYVAIAEARLNGVQMGLAL